ncbi:DUF6089 family protein [Flavobacterium sp.]|uniref:type IX secretion system protein PorG n=1 Tax=Flavobacterium sp. TaxID=239 RepID=UPI0035290EF7
MKRFLVYIVFISSLSAISQIHEIGVFAGGINYIGDIGPTDYVKPNEPAIGLVYKWNRSPRHSWRFSYKYGELKANDKDSEAPNRYLRGYSFKNYVHEFSAGLEFNFFEFDLHNFDKVFTPYVFTGVNYFIYDELYIDNKKSKTDYRNGQFAIPMVVGLKAKIAQQFVLGVEVGARYALTDNLDGSFPENDNFASIRFGNLNSNDWYVFSGITLTYTFGENPCFCPH